MIQIRTTQHTVLDDHCLDCAKKQVIYTEHKKKTIEFPSARGEVSHRRQSYYSMAARRGVLSSHVMRSLTSFQFSCVESIFLSFLFAFFCRYWISIRVWCGEACWEDWENLFLCRVSNKLKEVDRIVVRFPELTFTWETKRTQSSPWSCVSGEMCNFQFSQCWLAAYACWLQHHKTCTA